jgi:hypothetical protein
MPINKNLNLSKKQIKHLQLSTQQRFNYILHTYEALTCFGCFIDHFLVAHKYRIKTELNDQVKK